MYEVDRSTPEFRRYLELYETADLLALGRMADDTRWRLHPDPVVTYIIDRNSITPTCRCVALLPSRRPKLRTATS
jgi:2-iminoacetate synthase ThiH